MITHQAIRAQLRKILASESFVRSNRIQRFLEFIVEETLAGRTDQLGEYAIGVSVFDRGTDFDPALEPLVRNDARRLRLKLLEYYNQSRATDAVRIEIPKGGYVPVFSPFSAGERETLDQPRRIAVFPFEVLSAAQDDAMFGRALCMSLTANLTNLHGVEAVAHSYLREQPIREAASELRLSHAVHGSVMTHGNRRRVTINLIHLTDGTQLWAREYDLQSSEPLEITGTVISEVTARLGLRRPQLASFAMAA